MRFTKSNRRSSDAAEVLTQHLLAVELVASPFDRSDIPYGISMNRSVCDELAEVPLGNAQQRENLG